jgi:hypothetical protein
MEAIYLDCGARRPQLKRNPLGRSQEMGSTHKVLQPDFLDRIAIRKSISKQLDGIWIGSFGDASHSHAILQRVEEALGLIKRFDPNRYARLCRDLSRIWVLPLPGFNGRYNVTLNACQLDVTFVLHPQTPLALVAATIVHEATHARFQHSGISYREGFRPRIERACRRAEIGFAAKLPDGGAVRQRAEQALSIPDQVWSTRALHLREVQGYAKALHERGWPRWLLAMIVITGVVIAGTIAFIRRVASGLTRA